MGSEMCIRDRGKALVKLDSSKETGIIAGHDIDGADPEASLEKNLPIGKHLTMKITEYQNN